MKPTFSHSWNSFKIFCRKPTFEWYLSQRSSSSTQRSWEWGPRLFLAIMIQFSFDFAFIDHGIRMVLSIFHRFSRRLWNHHCFRLLTARFPQKRLACWGGATLTSPTPAARMPWFRFAKDSLPSTSWARSWPLRWWSVPTSRGTQVRAGCMTKRRGCLKNCFLWTNTWTLASLRCGPETTRKRMPSGTQGDLGKAASFAAIHTSIPMNGSIPNSQSVEDHWAPMKLQRVRRLQCFHAQLRFWFPRAPHRRLDHECLNV